MSYSRQDIETRKAELIAAMPELELRDDMDFGLQLRARDPETDLTMIVMRPRRFYQSEVNAPAALVVTWVNRARSRAA